MKKLKFVLQWNRKRNSGQKQQVMAVEISQSLGHQSLHQEIYLKRVPSSFCVLIVLVSSLCNPTQWCFQSGNSCDILCLDLQELLAQLQDFTHTLFNKISLSITINQHCHFPKRFYGLMLHSVTKNQVSILYNSLPEFRNSIFPKASFLGYIKQII